MMNWHSGVFKNHTQRARISLPAPLMVAALLLSVFVCAGGQAQTRNQIGAPAGTSGTGVAFNVPGGAMAEVLERFAHASGLQIVYGSEVTDNAQSLGVKGRYGRELALQVLLACTGVDYEFISERTVVLRRLIEVEPVFFDDAGDRLVGATRHRSLP